MEDGTLKSATHMNVCDTTSCEIRDLLVAIEGLVSWTRAHRQEIAAARSGYDARRESSA
jgi:hypothetical protein